MLQAAKPIVSDPSVFVKAVAEPKASNRWTVVLFSASGWFFDGYVINVWPLCIPLVMASFGLSIKDIGLVTSVYLVAYMLGTLGGGTLADYVGRKTMLSVSVLFYMVIDALTAAAQGFASLAVFRFLTGTGTGMELPVGSTFVSEAVKEGERSRMISIMNLGYPLGYLLAIIMFALIEPHWGWRGMFAASILPGLLVYAVRRKVMESQRFEAMLDRLKDGEIKRDRITLRTLLKGAYRKDALIAAVYWVCDCICHPGSAWCVANDYRPVGTSAVSGRRTDLRRGRRTVDHFIHAFRREFSDAHPRDCDRKYHGGRTSGSNRRTDCLRRICRALWHRLRATGRDGGLDLHHRRLPPEQGDQGPAAGGDLHLS
jgi:hypothetical protein